VGGTISGLASGGSGPSGLVLLDNGGDSEPIASGANGAFTFPTALPNGSHYNVTVQTSPAGESCNVGNGSGTVNGANIVNVTVTCGVSGALPPIISNVYYLPQYQNVEVTESNGYLCSIGDLNYAYTQNDSQETLEPLIGAGTESFGFYVAAPAVAAPLWGIGTFTLTCFGTDATGTTTPTQAPAFFGPLLTISASAAQPLPPLPQLAISYFIAEPSTNTLDWTTTNSTSGTVCSILDEYSSYNRIVQSSTVTQPPTLFLPANNSNFPYANACPATTIPFPDTLTLSCSDPTTGTAAKSTSVTFNANICP
jgi:hypothetical protein